MARKLKLNKRTKIILIVGLVILAVGLGLLLLFKKRLPTFFQARVKSKNTSADDDNPVVNTNTPYQMLASLATPSKTTFLGTLTALFNMYPAFGLSATNSMYLVPTSVQNLESIVNLANGGEGLNLPTPVAATYGTDYYIILNVNGSYKIITNNSPSIPFFDVDDGADPGEFGQPAVFRINWVNQNRPQPAQIGQEDASYVEILTTVLQVKVGSSYQNIVLCGSGPTQGYIKPASVNECGTSGVTTGFNTLIQSQSTSLKRKK